MKRRNNRKLITISSIIGLSYAIGIPFFLSANVNSNPSIQPTKSVNETKTESSSRTAPRYSGAINEYRDEENHIIYEAFSTSVGDISYRGFKARAIPGHTSYKLLEFPDPSQPNVPLISINSAFKNNKTITAMPAIPESVIEMTGAFWGCTNMVTFSNIPELCAIMDNAFRDCTSLNTQTITIPRSVVSLIDAFNGCTSLTANIIFGFAGNADSANFQAFNRSFSNTKIAKVTFRDPWLYSVKDEARRYFGAIPSETKLEAQLDTNFGVKTYEKDPLSFFNKYVTDVYYESSDPLFAANDLLKYVIPESMVTRTGYTDGWGNNVSKATEIRAKNISTSLKNGTITFEYEFKNYYEGTKFIVDKWKAGATSVNLTNFIKVTGATDIVVKPDSGLTSLIPSRINKGNFNTYFDFVNTPNGATITFDTIEGTDYVKPTVSGGKPSSKLYFSVTISRCFVATADGSDFQLTDGSKTITKTITDMQYTIPTTVTITPNTITDIYPSSYSSIQIKDSVVFENLPDNAYSRIVVTNRDTLDVDGFISLKIWASEYYDKNGALVEDSNFNNIDENDPTTWTNPFYEGKITGFNKIPGVSSVTTKQNEVNKHFPFQIAELVNKSTPEQAANLFFDISIPADSRITGCSSATHNNETGDVVVTLIFSKYVISVDGRLTVKTNYSKDMTLKTTKTFSGETTIDLTELNETLDKSRYPSQVKDNEVKRGLTIKNGTPPSLPQTTIESSITEFNEQAGSITVSVKITNYLSPDDVHGCVFKSDSVTKTYTVSGFYKAEGPTRVIPISSRGEELPEGDVTTADFSKYFRVINKPQIQASNFVEPYRVDSLFIDRSNKTMIAVVDLFTYFDEKSTYVSSSTPYKVTVVNSSFSRDTIIDNGWANGTYWLYLIAGVAGFILILLILIIVIIASFKGKRDQREYKLKRMVVENRFEKSSRLPYVGSHAPILAPSEIAPGGGSFKYVENGPRPNQIPSKLKKGEPIRRMPVNNPQQRKTTTTTTTIKKSSTKAPDNVEKK